MADRLKVNKTYKLYIGGAFVRSESGYTMSSHDQEDNLIAHVCKASRKDLRDTVKAARSAQKGWAGRTAYNRGQILYRIGEMLEARSTEFEDLLIREAGSDDPKAELQASVDRCVYYAGWSDKIDAILGSVNPIAGSFFGFTVPEPTGVVAVVADEASGLVGMVSQICSAVVSGNTVIVIAPDRAPVIAMEFAEVLATSDVPKGVINILTTEKAGLMTHLASHRDINAIDYRDGDAAVEQSLLDEGADNLKRMRFSDSMTAAEWNEESAQGLSEIAKFVEMKSVWHPVGV
jgi:acyl-CoA reductase-like NAD-dependent aldehyde dehydrogenase